MVEMEPRERILRAIRRQIPDRVPREAVFTCRLKKNFACVLTLQTMKPILAWTGVLSYFAGHNPQPIFPPIWWG